MPWAQQPSPERREVPPTPPCEQVLRQTRDWPWTSRLLFSHTRTFRHKYTKRKAYTSSPQHFLQGRHTERVIILNTATRQDDLRWSNTFELLGKGWVAEWTSHRFSEIGWMHSHHAELPAVSPPGKRLQESRPQSHVLSSSTEFHTQRPATQSSSSRLRKFLSTPSDYMVFQVKNGCLTERTGDPPPRC